MAKGLVQNATRRQALSYRRFSPNPIGVTSIAAINGRGAARANKRTKGRRPAVVVVKAKGKKTKTYRGAAAQAYLRRHHKKHYEKSDFGRLRLAFTTRSGERVSISPKATSRRTSDLSERVGRLSREDKKLERKVAAKKARRRTVEYVAGARVYKSRAAYERARALLDKKERAARRRRGSKPTAAQLRRAGKTLEKGAKKKKGRKTVSRRKSYKHDLHKLPMRAYREAQHGGRIKGSPVIGISEEDVVVVPARRNGKRRFKGVAKSGIVVRGKRIYGAAAEAVERRRAQGSSEIKRLSKSRHAARSKASRYVAPTSVSIYASPTAIDKHDAAIERIVKKYHGDDVGSGYDFRTKKRDVQFEFRSKDSAAKAKAALGRLRGVRAKVHVYKANGEDMRANKKRGKRKLSGAAKAAHDRRIASGKRSTKRTKKGHRRAPHAGKGLLSVKIGGKTFRTYMVKGKGGKVVHVPRYKLLGFKSERALQKVLQGSDEKKAEKISKRLQAIYKKRAAAAERVKKHGDVFTPNARRKHRYEDWSENTMKANKRRGKGKGRKSGRGHTKASRRAAAKKAAETRRLKRAKRSAAAKKAARTRKRHHAERSASSRKGRKHAKRGTSKRRKSGKGRHRSRSAAGKARWRAMSAAKKAKVLAALRRGRAAKRGGHRKGKASKAKYRKNHSTALANRGYTSNSRAVANRRRHHHHRRNGKFTMNGFGQSVKVALESGAVATAGFIAHRGLGWLLSEKLLSTISIFADASTSTTGTAGSMAPYRRIVAGIVVGAGGIVLAEKAMPKQATMLAAGIVVSFLQQVIVTALGQVAPAYVPAVSGYGGYGDRSGKAFKVFPGGIGRPMGEYFLTGAQGYGRSPMGEYFLTGANGFGATERAGRRRHIAAAGFGQPISQAAAGFGQPISQAAAGFGQPISQAAAGYGAAPMLSQAAAGVGEYFLTGANGIGEYEMVQPSGMSGAATMTDEGIQGGDTNAAERALNIAEGVAGVSDDNGIGVQSIVDPTDVAVPVNDEPGGSRAGILAGQEGIFGGAL